MKRLGKPLIVFLLLVAVVIVAAGVYVLLNLKKVPESGAREVVRQFSFSSANSLNEWDEKALSRKSTDYSVTEYDGKHCVKAVSDDSASALYYKQRLSCARNPFISWDWKAGKFPSRKTKEALKKKAEFDFAAQVYVIFYSRFFLNSKAIQYVWTEELPVGTAGSSPYTNNVKLLVLESGESREWKHEMRDVRADFRDLFGEELEKDVTAVSFMTDSDSTGTVAEAYYTNISIGYLETKNERSQPSDI